ncbi:MAG: M28 family peptidase [Balneolaceae bacterium]|nr:M28 family peptidase [Balneolaceae bacterium]MCH8548821.1 M28 family peptidase [Balneolaceae bacterium]
MQSIRYSAASLLFLISALLLISCGSDRDNLSGEEFLQIHVSWLADDAREGRLAGSAAEAESANYIENEFLQYGLIPAGADDTYIQLFRLTGPMASAMDVDNMISRNVAGFVEGTEYPDRFIVVGAHFDGQGMGGIISMDHDGEPVIHNSADDNASGTAGLLWLAKQISEDPLPKSVLFLAFSGEELGLLGSRHFVREMDIAADSITAMINLDMIGRLTNDEVTIFGTGTSPGWDEILTGISIDSLNVRTAPSGSGASDHTSFYEAGIPVLHYYSGTHEQYHTPSDTEDLINYRGMSMILAHTEQLIRTLGGLDSGALPFSRTEGTRGTMMPTDGVTLGVIPDYAYSGSGFRIESVRSGSTAEQAGLEAGDVIVGMKGEPVEDIYGYMDLLEGLEAGEEVELEIERDGERIRATANF